MQRRITSHVHQKLSSPDLANECSQLTNKAETESSQLFDFITLHHTYKHTYTHTHINKYAFWQFLAKLKRQPFSSVWLSLLRVRFSLLIEQKNRRKVNFCRSVCANAMKMRSITSHSECSHICRCIFRFLLVWRFFCWSFCCYLFLVPR